MIFDIDITMATITFTKTEYCVVLVTRVEVRSREKRTRPETLQYSLYQHIQIKFLPFVFRYRF